MVESVDNADLSHLISSEHQEYQPGSAPGKPGNDALVKSSHNVRITNAYNRRNRDQEMGCTLQGVEASQPILSDTELMDVKNVEKT
ncbi:hypothetical protein MUK42_19397 [Musa troglodytarum]|uniref:Uncharacterized protein n=1 Tax=Musa troglodytarum TaxID=320322 RepID=A0A9E7F148_9LILI|nr:hypothetical protein MUK42_19397 [Musa troglodytarum]